MNKYPLDEKGIENIALDIRQHDIFQREVIAKLASFLTAAISVIERDGSDNYLELLEESSNLLNSLHQRNTDFANFRFDQTNGHKLADGSPYPQVLAQVDSGGEMTEEEMAIHFKEPVKKASKGLTEKKLSKMSKEEIESWERSQDNDNDIYKLSARIKNLATMAAGNNLTDVGIMLTNTYTHVLKSLYDFAETVPDKETKIKLINLLRTKEKMPADFIAATQAKVKEIK